jgi:predicted nucleotidyltransferase
MILDRCPQTGQEWNVDRERAKAALKACEGELKALGVLSASIFGSVARGDARPDSDVDVVVRLSDEFSQGGFDYFARLEALQKRLSSMLGCRVDVIEEPVRKKRLQAEIDRYRALAF